MRTKTLRVSVALGMSALVVGQLGWQMGAGASSPTRDESLSPSAAKASSQRPPTITSLSRIEASRAGGTRITVHGTRFDHVVKVVFGNSTAHHLVVVSSRLLKVTTPRHAVGTVHVRVVTTHGISSRSRSSRFTFARQLTITTALFRTGTAGVRYLSVLKATGGTKPFAWSGRYVPAGLKVTRAGALSGTPSKTSVQRFVIRVRDALGWTVSKRVSISIPRALPAPCLPAACAILTPTTQTVQVPASLIGAITRDADGKPTQVLLSGSAPVPGQVLVLAPTRDAPSGAIVVVNQATSNSDGTTTVDVSQAGPADAYLNGTVKAVGSDAVVTDDLTKRRSARSASPAPQRSKSQIVPTPKVKATPSKASIDCDGDANADLYGMNVKPSLTPSMVLQWNHPVVGPLGGLKQYQFDLTGTLTLNLGVSVSGSGSCDLLIPGYTATVPAGGLGAIVLTLDPTVTFKVDGKLDIRTSVKLSCQTEYNWFRGRVSRESFCTPTTQPLQLSADSGVDATLKAKLAASMTLDDLVGVTGNLTGTVHAGFHPASHPVAELDAKVAYDLGACLVCFWRGSPLHVTIVSGTIFDRTVASYDGQPPPVPDPGNPVITTASLPPATVGQPYSGRLRTADNRNGSWSISAGSLPTGLSLDGDTITGKPVTPGTSSFTVSFVDTNGRSASRAETITVNSAGGSAPGAVQNLDYCRQNILEANDDGSTDEVAIPFAITYAGSAHTSLYVNNNGYVTFDAPSGTYTPYSMSDADGPIIAPFFADVDTRDPASALVTYGSSNGSFCVDWVGVGYYNQHSDKLDSFQLILTDRSDIAPGDFDITFNYGPMNWETGDASSGTGGIGGYSAVAGFADGTGDPATTFELPGSGVSGAMVEGGSDSLSAGSIGSGTPGRYIYQIRN